MAFGDQRGNHWLFIPALGIGLIIASYYDILPHMLGSRERIFTLGIGLLIVGIVCTGLFGHTIWLVPIALLLCSPLLVLFWTQEKYDTWRRKYRARNGQQGSAPTAITDEPSDARKLPVGRDFEP